MFVYFRGITFNDLRICNEYNPNIMTARTVGTLKIGRVKGHSG